MCETALIESPGCWWTLVCLTAFSSIYVIISNSCAVERDEMCKVTSLTRSENRPKWRFFSSEDIPWFSPYSYAPDRLKLNKTWFSSAIFLDCGLLHLTALSALFCSTFSLFPSNLRICTLGFIQSRIEWLIVHFPVMKCNPPLLPLAFFPLFLSQSVHLSLSLYNKHPRYPFHHFFPLSFVACMRMNAGF